MRRLVGKLGAKRGFVPPKRGAKVDFPITKRKQRLKLGQKGTATAVVAASEWIWSALN